MSKEQKKPLSFASRGFLGLLFALELFLAGCSPQPAETGLGLSQAEIRITNEYLEALSRDQVVNLFVSLLGSSHPINEEELDLLAKRLVEEFGDKNLVLEEQVTEIKNFYQITLERAAKDRLVLGEMVTNELLVATSSKRDPGLFLYVQGDEFKNKHPGLSENLPAEVYRALVAIDALRELERNLSSQFNDQNIDALGDGVVSGIGELRWALKETDLTLSNQESWQNYYQLLDIYYRMLAPSLELFFPDSSLADSLKRDRSFMLSYVEEFLVSGTVKQWIDKVDRNVSKADIRQADLVVPNIRNFLTQWANNNGVEYPDEAEKVMVKVIEQFRLNQRVPGTMNLVYKAKTVDGTKTFTIRFPLIKSTAELTPEGFISFSKEVPIFIYHNADQNSQGKDGFSPQAFLGLPFSVLDGQYLTNSGFRILYDTANGRLYLVPLQFFNDVSAKRQIAERLGILEQDLIELELDKVRTGSKTVLNPKSQASIRPSVGHGTSDDISLIIETSKGTLLATKENARSGGANSETMLLNALYNLWLGNYNFDPFFSMHLTEWSNTIPPKQMLVPVGQEGIIEIYRSTSPLGSDVNETSQVGWTRGLIPIHHSEQMQDPSPNIVSIKGRNYLRIIKLKASSAGQTFYYFVPQEQVGVYQTTGSERDMKTDVGVTALYLLFLRPVAMKNSVTQFGLIGLPDVLERVFQSLYTVGP